MLHNVGSIDLVTWNQSASWCELVLVADAGEWDAPGAKQALIDKLNCYLVYAVDGELAKAFPRVVGQRVKIVVQSLDPLPPWANELLTKVGVIAAQHGIELQNLPLEDPDDADRG